MSGETVTFIGEVMIRNRYRVLRVGSNYQIVGTDRKGSDHIQHVPIDLVAEFARRFAGQEISKDDAALAITPSARRLDLPYDGGYRLGFYCQSVLIALVAIGKARLRQDGRRWLYAVESR